jgi:hypothetical protein
LGSPNSALNIGILDGLGVYGSDWGRLPVQFAIF